MIEVKGLSKRYGVIKAVDDVSFSVARGEVLGFLGPNGAGKSTTIRVIAGYVPATSGTVLVDGTDIDKNPIETKKEIGYMPESNPLYRDMTTREFLTFIAEVHDLKDIPSTVEKTIAEANLKEVADQLIETLSKGYRSRLSFASAIIHNPPILLLDEPTDGLDPNQKNEIRSLIKTLSKDKAIIVSTHILEEVEAMCSRIILITEGRLVLDGTPEDLRRSCVSAGSVVMAIHPDSKEWEENILSTSLTLVVGRGDFTRYRTEKAMDPTEVNVLLSKNNVPCEEVFRYDPPLDEAFRRMTRTVG